MSSILNAVEIVVELNKHKILLDCAAVVVREDSPIPEVRAAATLLRNWDLQFDLLLDEITSFYGLINHPLCQRPKLETGKEILQNLLPSSPLGVQELQKLYESRYP